MSLNYTLASACENTFVIIDRLSHHSMDPLLTAQAHAWLIQEGRDDALILLNGRDVEGGLLFTMLVLGVDGAYGEFCGNGSRACAAYLYQQYPQYSHFFLELNQRAYPLLRSEQGFKASLPAVTFDFGRQFMDTSAALVFSEFYYSLEEAGFRFVYASLVEPHLLVEADLDDATLFQLGRWLNQRRDWFPLGININAFTVLETNHIRVRTYERGVQRLTQSCGSGSCCSATFYQRLRRLQGVVRVDTCGGTLYITPGPDSLEMSGPAIVGPHS